MLSSSSRAVTTLLTKLDKIRRNRCAKAVQNINCPAKKRGALLATSLAGQEPPPHYCPAPTSAIAEQLLRNGKYKIVSKEASDRWRTPTATPVNISGDFTTAEFAATL